MARKNHKFTINRELYITPYNTEELQEMRRKLAKRANQRMLQLERKGYDFGAIDTVKQYLSYQKEGKKRFTERKNYLTDHMELKREISTLESFLDAPTSTIRGMKQIEKKRQSSFESGKWGVRYKLSGELNRQLHFASTKEFYNFLNSQTFSDLMGQGFSSETLIELYDSARTVSETTDDEIYEKLESALNEFRGKTQKPQVKYLAEKLGVKMEDLL